jgi:uncharacterized protein YhdP
MKFVFRWAFRLLVLALVLAVGLLLLKDLILREWVQYQARAATGLDVRIGGLSLSLFQPIFSLKDLTVFNPAEFGGGPLISLPEVHVEYDRGRLASRHLRLRLLRVSVSEMSVVQDAAGRSNLDAIGASLRARTNQTGGSGLAFDGIDTLNLSLGMVRYLNLGAPERNRTYDLRIRNEVLTNLRTQSDVYLAFARLAFKATMGGTAPPGLTLPRPPGVPSATNGPPSARPPRGR